MQGEGRAGVPPLCFKYLIMRQMWQPASTYVISANHLSEKMVHKYTVRLWLCSLRVVDMQKYMRRGVAGLVTEIVC